MKRLLAGIIGAAAVAATGAASAANIGTAAEFVDAMTNDPTGSHTLTADIDLTGAGYATVASFSGMLNGAGHTLSGIGAQPLFAHLAGTVKNLTLDGTGVVRKSWPQAQTDYLAVIATYAGDASFENCVVKSYDIPTPFRNRGAFYVCVASNNVAFAGCSIAADCASTGANNSYQGGFIADLVAKADTGTVCSFLDCTNSATMTKGGDYNDSFGCGGFISRVAVGMAKTAKSTVAFTRCVNNGTAVVGTKGHFGGFVAVASGPKDFYASGYVRLAFTDCLSACDAAPSDMKSDSTGYRAGFVSQCGSGVVVDMKGCVNRGNINAGGETYAAGFVANFAANVGEVIPSVFEDCANYGTITGRVNAAGFAATASSGRVVLNPAVKFVNCGNYGAVTTDGSAGVFFANLGSNVRVSCDNCFTLTDNHCGTVATAAYFTTANMWTPQTAGYTAEGACASLAAVAKEKGCNKFWKVGRASGYPELVKWSGDKYVIHTVRYLDDDGTVLHEQDVEDGYAADSVEDPEHSGFVFTGWNPQVPKTVTASVDVSATYREREAGEIGCRADFVADLTANPDGSFRLAHDINLADSGYVTIADFSGVLDGLGHKVSNLGAQSLFTTLSGTARNLDIDGRVKGDNTVLALGSKSWAVLCVTAKGATVENVTVAGYSISEGQTVIGLIVAEATTTTTAGCVFSNCTTDASCSLVGNVKHNRMHCGGIVGKVSRGAEFIGECVRFVDCTNNAAISSAASDQYGISGVAGICGYIGVNRGVDDGQLPSVHFVRCANRGAVSGGRYNSIGGLVGRFDGPSYHNKQALMRGSFATLTDCSNAGAVTFVGSVAGGVMYSGGVIGAVMNNGSAFLTNCVNRADVIAECAGEYTVSGGLVGLVSTSGLGNELVNCANYGAVTGTQVGGMVGKIETNTGWDVGNVRWFNCANYGALTTLPDEATASSGQVVGRILSGKSSLNHYDAVNCFVSGETLCGAYSVFTATDVKSSTDADYSPRAAVATLNAAAAEKGWAEWIRGTKPDGDAVPELKPFCVKPFARGMMFFIGGTPSVPSAQPDEPEEPPPGESPAVAEQLLNLAPAPSGGRFVVPADRTWPAKPGAADICLWHDDRFAACAITIDDNCRPDHAWWQALADELDIRFTWFVVTDGVDAQGTREGTFDGNWSEWQEMANRGHSIQSHTTNHKSDPAPKDRTPDTQLLTEAELRGMYKDSLDAINAHVTNNVACCIAYPSGDAHEDIVKDYAIAARGVYGVPSAANTINYLCTNKGGPNKGTVEMVAFGETQEEPKWIQPMKGLKRGLNVVLYHYVHAGKTDAERAANAANAEAEVRYIASFRDDRLWVCRFDDVMKYAQERDSATLKVTENTAERISFDLSDRMKDELFDFPLTVKVRLPDGWKTVKATQGGKPVEAKVVAHESANYALVKAVPDRGTVALFQ